MGHVVFRYADEIFKLGREMVDSVQGSPSGKPLRLNVGITEVVPKLVVRRLLEPALKLAQPVRLVCFEGSYEKLLKDLALHALDLVIADSPVPSGSKVKAFNHLLGETGVSVFGTTQLYQKYKHGFPRSLDGAPLLLPLEGLTLRRSLDQWLQQNQINPFVAGEFQDAALLKEFGADGVGLFVAPTVVEQEVVEHFRVKVLGRIEDVRERFYAVSAERRLKNPATVAISEAAHQKFFANRPTL
jgi:LysR family transcriptional activator of nhaA